MTVSVPDVKVVSQSRSSGGSGVVYIRHTEYFGLSIGAGLVYSGPTRVTGSTDWVTTFTSGTDTVTVQ